jgi:hypothetical protein
MSSPADRRIYDGLPMSAEWKNGVIREIQLDDVGMSVCER